jgi:hypothetical protein
MVIAKQIKRLISNIPEGEIFDYRRFNTENQKEQAVIKTLSRLVKSGDITRMEKGKYYKPRQTRFGSIRPSENEIIKSLTIKNNQPVGYLTGTALFNQLGLTTQVSNTLTIASSSRLPPKELNGYKIKFVTNPIKFTKKDIPLLQLLDCLKDIKEIPDTSPEKALLAIINHIKNLSPEQLIRIKTLAGFYNPATKALLGAIFELYFSAIPVNDLKDSLNPLSRYKLNISENILPNKSKWFIE